MPPTSVWKRFFSRRGQTLIAFTLFLGTLLGFLGLLFDGGQLYFARRLAQSAADSAAVGAAFELQRGNIDKVEAAGLADALLNGFDNDSSDVDVIVNNPPSSGSAAGSASHVEVTVITRFPTTFMRLFNVNESAVSARAVAGLEAEIGPACILALNPTAAGALTVSGTADVSATDCNVMVNSNSPAAIVTDGGGCVTANRIGFVRNGSYLGNGQACVSPQPEGQAIPAPDPYAYLVEPDPGDYVQRSGSTLQITSGNAAAISPLLPGYYKGGIKITGGTVVFTPGLYLIEGMDISGDTTIVGSDVTFYNNGSGLKGITITATVDATLSAPFSGDWTNILFFNSRSIPNNNLTEIKIAGTSDSSFEGVQYFPSVHVDYLGTSIVGPTWAVLVADTITVAGRANLTTSFDATSGRTPTTTRVALVE